MEYIIDKNKRAKNFKENYALVLDCADKYKQLHLQCGVINIMIGEKDKMDSVGIQLNHNVFLSLFKDFEVEEKEMREKLYELSLEMDGKKFFCMLNDDEYRQYIIDKMPKADAMPGADY